MVYVYARWKGYGVHDMMPVSNGAFKKAVRARPQGETTTFSPSLPSASSLLLSLAFALSPPIASSIRCFQVPRLPLCPTISATHRSVAAQIEAVGEAQVKVEQKLHSFRQAAETAMADFRAQVEERFGAVTTQIDTRVGRVETGVSTVQVSLAEVRARARVEMRGKGD